MANKQLSLNMDKQLSLNIPLTLPPGAIDDGDTGRQARGMAIAAITHIEKNPLGYTIPSLSGNGTYVMSNQDGGFCSCPDFAARLQRCKHLYALEFTIQRGGKARRNQRRNQDGPHRLHRAGLASLQCGSGKRAGTFRYFAETALRHHPSAATAGPRTTQAAPGRHGLCRRRQGLQRYEWATSHGGTFSTHMQTGWWTGCPASAASPAIWRTPSSHRSSRGLSSRAHCHSSRWRSGSPWTPADSPPASLTGGSATNGASKSRRPDG